MKPAARSGSPESGKRPYAPRKTIYELPPLELECMKVLWARGESSVRQIRERLAAARRPLAYTTVETIMDRLTRKSAVSRRKVGKAHFYTPAYPREQARAQAVRAVVEHFFDGSRASLRAYLDGAPVKDARRPLPAAPATARPSSRPAAPAPRKAERPFGSAPGKPAKGKPPLDTTLL